MTKSSTDKVKPRATAHESRAGGGPRETRAGSAGPGVNKTRRRGAQSAFTSEHFASTVTISPLQHPVPISQFSPRPHPVSAARRVPPAAATRPAMTTSRRVADRKIARFEKNITKRGAVPETIKKANDYPVGPILLGFFVFVVVGSSLFQIIRTASGAGLFF
ncbi:uncharacterized protein LOC111256414 [Setaria italica]|nr:uncharacterized protein LOC111256414 [Setaria italica]XP_034581048.1 uncharacterized protein LOC117844458 [Setaria viridis]